MLLNQLFDRENDTDTIERQYLWAVGIPAEKIPVGQTVADRYRVVAPQIWLDERPDCVPDFPEDIPPTVLPYLRLCPAQLHVPQVYGFCQGTEDAETREILLLENAPIDRHGNLYPTLVQRWAEASPIRQAYWLWQTLTLWRVLDEQGATASLLEPENLRVQGWRLWLLEVRSGNVQHTLKDLAYHWSSWIAASPNIIADPVDRLCQRMRDGEDLDAIAASLNTLLLQLAAQQPLRLDIAGDTDSGPLRSHNEDTCYPTASDLEEADEDPLFPHLAVLCDGVGGHEGGEVASQTAVRSLVLQVRTFWKQLQQESELLSPDIIQNHLAAIVRVTNNTIAHQNDSQDRIANQRMGTTLVLAWQLPQAVRSTTGTRFTNAHELYLVSVGDSRAYWLTRDYCQCLTVDDDVATREVRFGRGFYRQALQRTDAGALTQAIGTRDGDLIHPTLQRFIVEEDGILLLCSDGLSDNDWVEKSWRHVAPAVLDGDCTPQEAVRAWIQLANEKNGHDNTSIVTMVCRVTPPRPKDLDVLDPQQRSTDVGYPESDLSESSKALLYGQSVDLDPESARRRRRRPTSRPLAMAAGVLLTLLLGAIVFWIAYTQLRSDSNSDRPLPRDEEMMR
ncbi:serine/threonine protein phosphatase [Leptolyngbya valderiana BDU 20041]|nr:serine/threonine protein phosphatase [Leptolyngbya valderiana BDU 20041]PPT09724.1 Protein phosphatase [Geitlerinema sp. FC II]